MPVSSRRRDGRRHGCRGGWKQFPMSARAQWSVTWRANLHASSNIQSGHRGHDPCRLDPAVGHQRDPHASSSRSPRFGHVLRPRRHLDRWLGREQRCHGIASGRGTGRVYRALRLALRGVTAQWHARIVRRLRRPDYRDDDDQQRRRRPRHARRRDVDRRCDGGQRRSHLQLRGHPSGRHRGRRPCRYLLEPERTQPDDRDPRRRLSALRRQCDLRVRRPH